MNFWIKYNEFISNWSLIMMAFFINMSISLTQIFFTLALLVWLINAILFKIKNKSLDEAWVKYKNDYLTVKFQYFLGILLAWILLRLLHIVISEHSIKELIQFREVWLFFILPLVIYKVKESRVINLMILFLLLGAVITSMYNSYFFFNSGEKLGHFVAAGFLHTNNPLTYAGTMSFSIVLGIGLFFYYIKRKSIKLSILFSILLVIAIFGLLLTSKRGPFIAIGVTTIFIFFLVLRKKFFWILPIFIVIPLLYIQQSDSIKHLFSLNTVMPKSHEGTLGMRIDMWLAGIKMWLDHLWLGVGDADFKFRYPKYMVEGAIRTARMGSHMHNDFLNTLVLYGSIGFSIFIMFFIIPIIDFFKKYYVIIKSDRKWILFTSVSGIFMMMILGLSQCHYTDEEVQMVFWLTVAIFYRELLQVKEEKTNE